MLYIFVTVINIYTHIHTYEMRTFYLLQKFARVASIREIILLCAWLRTFDVCD